MNPFEEGRIPKYPLNNMNKITPICIGISNAI